MYFMHSYAVRDVPRERVLAETRYGGQEFCSAAVGDGVGGVQFHPELSGPVGLSVYALFGGMAGMAMNSRGIDDAYVNSGT
jgi:glutamine amidotransferase